MPLLYLGETRFEFPLKRADVYCRAILIASLYNVHSLRRRSGTHPDKGKHEM